MTTTPVFARVVAALEGAGIPYMLTGSFASSAHGVPRATRDIDFVVAPTSDSLHALAGLLPPDSFYFDLDSALEALRRETQFNVLEFSSGWKFDLIIRKSRPFSRAEFDRRQVVEFHGLQLAVASAEDVVLAKLEWAMLGGSRRQVEDAAGILRARSGRIDLQWIARWVPELGIGTQWEEASRLAGLG